MVRAADRQRATLRDRVAGGYARVAGLFSRSVLIMFGLPIGHISVLLLIPVLGAALLILVPRRQTQTLFSLAALASGLDFLWSVKIFALFDAATGEMQLVERAPWMPSFGIQYLVGIDGISLFLVLLTTLLMPVAILASWSVKERVKEYLIFMLLLETGMLGAFVALDLFLFYVFWEVMLVPMYFLIGVWGGTRRIYAALKFVVYTMTGSLLMLVAIIYLATRHAQVEQALTFDVLKLYDLRLPFDQQLWLFLAFALSFAIKVPLFPLHTWLPDAHVEAPTAGSVILAGVLLKLGTYGFVRFSLPMLPDASQAMTPLIAALSIIAIIYGAYRALAQVDLKKLIAYSSVSHMGFVTLGLFVMNQQGIEGAILQMVNHGITTGALFLCVGIIYERTHSRLIADNVGLAKPMPVYATLLVIFALSSLGLPGTNSFVGEFLVLVGTFLWSKAAAALASLGVILAAAYLLYMIQRVVFGVALPRELPH